ncbi:asialoglycoprotein receptor 1-like isoform X2 [Lepus europaeus]|uniref:asialoglycoprotein receptor 1-like isoform X2 n=1 Tax=Lepus europaeus TaxID=9983 RepID=UPI002B45FF06|nr:asialoglycoprotein receptor 1-like isoform X2 [Lepus europaeus]
MDPAPFLPLSRAVHLAQALAPPYPGICTPLREPGARRPDLQQPQPQPGTSAIMTKEYQDLQHLDNEDSDHHQLRKGPPAPQPLLRRLCSGSRLLLLSLGLSLLLLVVVCVIGSQNSHLQEELRALRETLNNFTSSTGAEVTALSSKGASVGKKMKSLESEMEKLQQDLKEDHSSLLLHVKQFVSDLRSLSCQMAALQGNGSAGTCCPVNWVEYEGSCYWFSRTGKPWPEADRYCRLENAHLVVVTSREEQKFIEHHIGYLNTWMGLSDPDGVWKWVDGTDYEAGYQNWRPGQPDDWSGHGLGGGEDCAHFTNDGRWNDDMCQRPYRWVCETKLGPAA